MSFNIWRITDGKPGHDSQSQGLCNAIQKLVPCTSYDISIAHCRNIFLNLLLKDFPTSDALPDPKLIIGAGHRTHLPMLAAKHARGGKSIVLMKPGLPRFFFDYCIVPEHDQATTTANTIFTLGAINTVVADQNKNKNQILILIGGPSRHFHWNSKKIFEQISRLIDHHKEKDCIITGSRRTPDDFFSLFDTIKHERVRLYTEKLCGRKKLNTFISSAEEIWVSKDSVSMIYEALSSGAKVGVLKLKPKKNKLDTSINILIEKDYLTTFCSWEKTKKLYTGRTRLNEARRCAKKLKEMGAFD